MNEATLLEHVLELAQLRSGALPPKARLLARLSLFDWLVCVRAGMNEPLADIMRGMIAAEGGAPIASVAGGTPAPARAAALVNGAIGHALDYDDTHFAHVGHPSAAIYPAALAVGEMVNGSAEEVCSAFLVGAEASIRIGCVLGASHYNRGFHQTATAGAFGATVAAARLMRLSPAQLRAAIGLCATRSSGLRSQFGSMGKPYNAGIAASNGVEAALLARASLTSADDGLGGPLGFIATHSDAPQPLPEVGEGFLFEDIKYKLHACCHGTHAMIEALLASIASHGLKAADVSQVTLRTNPRWLTVCDIKQPRTGLELKFSYGWLAAMVLSGRPTQDDRVFTDPLTGDPALAAIAGRVKVEGDPGLSDMQARGSILLADGRSLPFEHDLAGPLPLDDLEDRLRRKARAVLGPGAQRIEAAFGDIEELSARELGALLAQPSSAY